jgi:pyruvate formate-lyase/glycerol dehydratase family glycyl radical enzyme
LITKTTRSKNMMEFSEVDKVNVLTDRVKRLKQRRDQAVPHVCSERSRLATESWKETEGEPLDIRRAKLFSRVLKGLTIVIRDDELIVGSQTKYVRGASPALDWSPQIGSGTVLAQKITSSGDTEEAIITEEDRQRIIEDCRYWSGRSPSDAIRKARETRFPKSTDWIASGIVTIDIEKGPPAAKPLDYGKVIARGLEETILDAREELSKLEYTDHPEDDYNKDCFLQAVVIACESVIEFAHRYAQLAKAMAQKEKNTVRKNELEKITEVCERVPAKPPRSFYEALQSFWLTHICHNLEEAGLAEAPGRMDQYLYPLYEKDIREAKLTRQEAAELLGCLWVKFDEMEAVKDAHSKQNVPGTHLQDVTVCGVTRDGKDASNELSYMLLEVVAQMKTPQPPLYFRYHDQINRKMLIKAAEVNVRNGSGNPAFVNDGSTLHGLSLHGISLQDAREWAVQGCANAGIPTSSLEGSGCYMNIAKVFELALNNGCDPATGNQLSLATGDPRTFTSVDQLITAFKQQVDYILREWGKVIRLCWFARSANYTLPFASSLLGDCIRKGKDALKGGIRYPQMLATINIRGVQNSADSLAAIKKLVFEEKKISMEELLKAISVNFEGKEDMRMMLQSAPKYGNDDDYVDDIFNDLSLWLQVRTGEEKNPFGAKLYPCRTGAVVHVIFGKRVGALPDGRKAGEPLADGFLSPGQGRDVKGPTAMLNSASKVNHTENSKSALLNMKFDRKTLDTPEKLEKFLSLIETFFDRGGFHIQFNILDRSTLLEAQKHPEQYRNLMVRVAGFSAYFVNLAPELQNEILSRTEYQCE